MIKLKKNEKKNKMKTNILSIHKGMYEVSQVPIRHETISGVQYAVVPVTMMTVGVHAGSDGPMLYTADQLAEFHWAWNGVPVCIEHPQVDGQYVSCNHPQFYEKQVIGKIFNTYFEGTKLKAEAWLEVDKSSDILAYIQSGQKLEVSTGLFSEGVLTPGSFNGEAYEAIANKIRPDHLALLPGGVGACSWQDGCGVRANEGEEMVVKKKEDKDTNTQVFNKRDQSQDEIKVYLSANEIDYTRLIEMVRNKVNTMDIDNERYHYTRKVYDSYVVYEMCQYNKNDKLYKRDYTILNEDVEWVSDPMEVIEEITYKPVSNKGDTKVDKKKNEVCCIEEVKAFVSNEDNSYTEKDIEWLSVLPEDNFKAIVLNSTKPKKEIKVEDTKKEVTTIEELLANATSELKESIQYGQQILKEKKIQLIDGIKANKSNKFTDAELNAYDINMLEKLNASFGVPVSNYVGAIGGHIPRVNNESVEEPLEDIYNVKESK